MAISEKIKKGRSAFNAMENGGQRASSWVTQAIIENDFESITGLGQLLYDSKEIVYDDLGEPTLIKDADTGKVVKKTRTGTASRRYGALRKLVERRSLIINATPVKLVVNKGKVVLVNNPKPEPETPDPAGEPETPETPETPEALPEADEIGEWLKEIRLLWDKAPTRGAQKAFLEQAVREFTGK